MDGLAEFTVGGVLRRTAEIVRRRGATLLALASLLYALPVAALGMLPWLGLVPTADAVQTAASSGQPVIGSELATLVAFGLASAAVLILGSMLATSAVVWTAHEGLHGRPATLGGGAARAFRVLLPNVGLSILYGLGVLLASLLLVVPGVMLFLRWSVSLPALVVERAGVLGSLGRSRDLTSGHRWAVLGFLLLVYVAIGLVFLAVKLVGSAIGGSGGFAVGEALGFVTNAVVSAVGAAATAALYVELRRAREGDTSSEVADAFR